MSSEEIADLTDRNRRLADTLREARDQMLALNESVKEQTRNIAIGESLDYVIVALDRRIAEVGRAIYRGAVGTAQDGAMGLAGQQLPAIFETALLAHGFRVVPVDVDSS